MESSRSIIPIELGQLEQFMERANRFIASVSWAPKGNIVDAKKEPAGAAVWRESATSQSAAQEISLLKVARLISKDPLLLSEETNHVLTVLRRALCLGMHLSKVYTNFSGLDQLIALNNKGGLGETQMAEFRAKYYTASAITAYVVAYYVVWELGQYKREEVAGINMEFRGIPEFSFRDPVSALECMVFYFAQYGERAGLVNNNLEFVKLALLYFDAVLDEIAMRKAGLQYHEPFSGHNYKLDKSEFCVSGFEPERIGQESSVEFNRVELGDIVGNRDAKHDARRLAARLMCYDFPTKRNPIFDLGGLSTVSLGYGEPGTGKSMLIAALATMLHDYCKNLGVPFLFWPLPDTIVSTYQGGSAERMMSWMKVLKDPSKIIYAPIDDAENNLEDRSRPGVSAGVREVIAVFLRNTEGAYAVNHGNALIQLFTNLPDQIDKAVMSRINNRSYIGGAKSLNDFLDQDYLWMRKHREIDPTFVGMRDPKGYSYLSDQALVHNLSQVYAGFTGPTEERILPIYEQVSKKHKPDEQTFFAEFFVQLKNSYPFFTSRDVRNIQRAVDSRIMDFELPDEWLVHPDVFFKHDYETKKGMIIELMKANMKGLSFAEIRLQEAIRYVDNMVKIADTGRKRRVEELVQELTLQQEARSKLAQS